MVSSVMADRRLHNRLTRLTYLLFIEPLLHGAKQRVCSLVGELGKSRILEIGCGTCVQAVMIAKRGIQVTAVDLSDELFPPPLSARLPPTLRFFQADGRALPFRDREFDLVLTSMVLHQMDPAGRPALLGEMGRVLRKDGTLLIMDFDFPLEADRGWTARLIRWIEKMAGKEHHGNFRNFMATGGVPALLQSLGAPQFSRHPILDDRGAIFEVPQRDGREEGG